MHKKIRNFLCRFSWKNIHCFPKLWKTATSIAWMSDRAHQNDVYHYANTPANCKYHRSTRSRIYMQLREFVRDSRPLTWPSNKHPRVIYGTHSHVADEVCKWIALQDRATARHMTRLRSIFDTPPDTFVWDFWLAIEKNGICFEYYTYFWIN